MSTTARIRTAALVAATVAFAAAATWQSWIGTSLPAFAYWLAVCVAGELLWIRLPLGSATISMASCFNFAALLLLSRGEAMAVTGLATLAAELAVVRKPPVRALFNASQTALAAGSASWAFHLAGGSGRDLLAQVAGLGVAPLLAAALLYYAVNRVAVTLAIASSAGIPFVAAWRRNFGSRYELLSAGAVLSLGALVATLHSAVGFTAAAFVILPLLLAADGIRRRSRETAPAEPDAGAERAA